METITENQVKLAGASLQVELTNANSLATPVAVLDCPASAVTANAPVFRTQLRGYSK
jgi:hypothetical protein